MGSLIGIAAGGWLAWNFGYPVGSFLFASTNGLLAAHAVLFVVGFVLGKGFIAAIQGRFVLSGGGLWSSAFGRRLIGLTADGIVWLMGFLALLWTLSALAIPLAKRIYPEGSTGLTVIAAAVVITGYFLVGWITPYLKVAIGKASRPFRHLWRSLLHGVGGSSRFEGMLEEWANPWKPGHVFLGTSLYDPQWKVGKRDNRHLCTVATSRSGKGVSGIIPNLIHWPGSVFVIDPKGENAAVTAKRRADLGQTVRIVDPFDVLKDLGLHGSAKHWSLASPFPVFRFNPLAEIDLEARDVVEQIRRVTDALVMATSTTNPFFDNASKKIISGVIAHVLSHHSVADEDKHLGTVRDFMLDANGRDMTQLAGNRALGGLPAAAAHALKTGSDGAAGDVMFTVQVHTEWLDSLAMRHCLSASEFTLKDLKAQDVSLYLVLPAEMLYEHARFLRLFVNLMVRAVSKGVKSNHPIMFVLDEFHSLGTLPILSSAAGITAGFGVKIWPILQNLSQLQELYPNSWENFLASAAIQQVFAVNDQTTGRYFSERLGHHISWRKMRTQLGPEWVPQSATWLRTSTEFARESSRDSNNQIVFMEGGDAFLLRRAPYFETFPPSMYSPNPYEPEAAVPAYGSWSDRMDARWRAWVKRRTNIDLDAMADDAAMDSAVDRFFEPLMERAERLDERWRQKRAAREAARRPAVSPLAGQTLTTQAVPDGPVRGPDGQETAPTPEAVRTMTEAAQPDRGQLPQPMAGNGAAAEVQVTQPPPMPVQADTPRQVNGDGIDWRSIEAEWDLVPAPQQAERAPTQTDVQEPGLRPPPPLKAARRKRTQP